MECSWCLFLIAFLLLTFIFSLISSKLRYLLKFIYLYSAYTIVSLFVVLFFLLRPRNPKNAVIVAKVMKYIHKLVPIQFTIEGAELLENLSSCVVILNHQSALDLMCLFEIWPLLGHAGPVAKKELLYFEPFGLACWMCGAEFLNRRSKTSHSDINLMGARAMDEGKKLMIFPEGTRNGAKDLSMLPFKKGAFHIAINGKLPIQPVVISEYDFLDWKKMVFNPGKVTIKMLPIIDTSEYNKDNIDELVTKSRDSMLMALKSLSKSKAE